jgi:hypothetical protein
LRKVEYSLFAGCISLKSIFLPSSLRITSGSLFTCSSIEEIHIDEANPYCFISRGFLTPRGEMRLIGHIGLSDSLVIPQQYDAIGRDCFLYRKNSLTVTFEDGTKLTRLDDHAFYWCYSLGSICIPACVTVLGESCFSLCEYLRQVTFESGSHLTEIGPYAFSGCSRLSSICIPARVEFIPWDCFSFCSSLTTVSFEPGAKLARIDGCAFFKCHSLHYFAIPGQLEILKENSFSMSRSLAQLTFEIPSRMRQLCLPNVCIDSLYIPDSVEFISGTFEKVEDRAPLLQFGRESRLEEIIFDQFCRLNPDVPHCIFVCLPEEVLRRFRFKFEDLWWLTEGNWW